MKGRTPTAEQKRFWGMLAREVGCIASRKDGFWEPRVSIHHIDGRTKPDAHWLVLPLSAGNHQDGTGASGRIAVHPWKARFEARYGTQRELLRECIQILLDRGCDVPEGVLRAAGMKRPEKTVEVFSGHVRHIHGDEFVNKEIVGEKAHARQGRAA